MDLTEVNRQSKRLLLSRFKFTIPTVNTRSKEECNKKIRRGEETDIEIRLYREHVQVTFRNQTLRDHIATDGHLRLSHESRVYKIICDIIVLNVIRNVRSIKDIYNLATFTTLIRAVFIIVNPMDFKFQ